MNKKLFKTVAAITSVLAIGSAAVACGGDENPSEPVKYAVSYALNGGSGTLPTESNKAAGEKFELASATGLSKDDHTFDGWSDGTIKYAAGAEYTMPAHAVTFTAQWKENDAVEFTVTYSLNGGIGTLPTESNKTEGEKFDLASATGLSKEHHTFDGWSDGTIKYAAGAEYTMPAHDVTFTAQWKVDEQTPAVTDIIEFSGNCEIPPIHQGLMQFDGGVVVGLKIDGANGKAYYKLQDGEWTDGKYLINHSTVSYKPDKYGSDAYYYEIKIENIAHYVLINSEKTKLYLYDRDDEPLANGEFTAVSTENPENPDNPENPPKDTYTVTYVKPQGVEGTVPEAVNVESGDKHTLKENTFTKTGWTFYKWQVNDDENLRAANTQYTVTKNTTVTPVFQKTYTGDYYDGNLILTDNGKAYVKGSMSDSLIGQYTREGDEIVIEDKEAGSVIFEINDGAGTYSVIMLDGLQDFEFTANDGTTKLTFDGRGKAMLGTVACTYTWDENESMTINLVAGGNTVAVKLEGTYPNLKINVKISVNGTDYIFGNVSEPEEPLTGKLYDFAGEGSANAVVYGYSTAEEAQAANSALVVENKNSQSHIYYTVKVYYTPTNNNKLVINVIRKGNFNPTAGNAKINGEDITDIEIANQIVVIDNPNTYDNVFKIKFRYNKDGKRTVTISYGSTLSVTWVEITQ